MALTTSAKLYAPEVWADLGLAEFLGKVVVANAAITNDTLTGKPGETALFPEWDALGELDDLTEGVAMTPVTMGQSRTKVTIKEAGKAVEITDTARLTGLGDPQGEAIKQFGILAARKVDTDLTTAALATITGGRTRPDGSVIGDDAPLAYTGPMSWPGLVGAKAVFGDDLDLTEVCGLFIRSSELATISLDDQFIDASKTAAGNNLVLRGQIGTIGGIKVFVTDRLPVGKAMILKNSALGLMYKRRPLVEQDRDILKRSNLVTTTLHYAVKRIKRRGVLAWTITAPSGD